MSIPRSRGPHCRTPAASGCRCGELSPILIALHSGARRALDSTWIPSCPTLLVSGGSQGALRINTAVAGAWPELLANGIQVLHVLGPKNLVPGIERSVA